jgi:hypothetical protein
LADDVILDESLADTVAADQGPNRCYRHDHCCCCCWVVVVVVVRARVFVCVCVCVCVCDSVSQVLRNVDNDSHLLYSM